jgi:signal peptidase II
MKKRVIDYLYLFGFAGLIVALDQWTKSVVRQRLAFGLTWAPWDWLETYARIVHWQNTGAAFGLGQNLSLVFMLLTVVVVAMIVYYFPSIPREEWPLRVALTLQLGGAVGNLIDRLTQDGSVTDFISIGRFPVFNVADASISIGVAVLIVGMWIQERKAESASVESDAQASEPDSSLSVENLQGE